MSKIVNEDLEKAELYLKEAHTEFDFIHEVRKKLDDKISNMIVLSGVLVNLLFGLGYFLYERQITAYSTLCLVILSLLSYLTVTIIGLVYYNPLKIQARSTQKVMEKYEEVGKKGKLQTVKLHIAYNLSLDSRENQKAITKKLYGLRMMLYAFTSGLFFIMFALISIFF